ncbi:MAG: aldehyde dehydrogenase family protein [Candidatus Dormibacteraceae bacterium]
MATEMLIAGSPPQGQEEIPVLSPFSGEQIGAVRAATDADVDRAIESAALGARTAAALTAHNRAVLLERAADLCDASIERLAALVVSEQGKTISEARREAGRIGPLLRLCAGEARRLHGETLPLDGSADGAGRLGMTLRIPCGVVVAITPFNYPLLLVAHKVGPALAAGNAVILKPSTLTPLSALALCRLLLEAGFAQETVQCVTGSGSAVGAMLCSDDRVRVVTFTGSVSVGQAIARAAGAKRTLLELGANCPVVVLPDADLAAAAATIASGGTANAGQVCISVQRVIAHSAIYDEFLDALTAEVRQISVGDPMSEQTRMGPMITPAEASRVDATIREAVSRGARVLTGGERDKSLYDATVVADVPTESRLFTDELFGPAVGVTRCSNVDEAIELCNRTSYGLAAGVFTRDVHAAIRFAREVEAGNVHINWSPLWRVDAMPYGGLKLSGLGKEGPRYAVEEMSESKTVVFHPPAGR